MIIESNHILVIGHDVEVARNLRLGLTWEGYRVVCKTTAQEGIAYVHERDPHLIILNIGLSNASLFEACRRMRELKLYQPIVILTERKKEQEKVLGLDAGADDYVTIPYSVPELHARLRALMRRSYNGLSASKDAMLRAGDLVVDLDRRQVSRGDKRLKLTPTEFQMLTFLMRHHGQTLSRSQIIDAVWGYDAQIESEATVNVYIRRLRAKVEHDPSHPILLRTVPGFGYLFAA